jgi:heptosyltransferase-1
MLKLLMVKTSSLGDVIHNLPVMNDILQHFPDAHIDWVVEESFADIPRLHPQVKNVFSVAIRRWKKQLFSKNTWAEIAAFKKLMQENQYDAIIDTQGLLKSALITYFAHGEKHGYDKNSIREPLASWFYNKTYAISYQQHAINRNRTLVAMSLGYTPPTSAPNYGILSTIIQNDHPVTLMNIGLHGNYIVALHGTSRDNKLWPVSHWVDLGNQLARQSFNLALPWANKAEFNRAHEIAKKLGNATVLPKLSITELASVISSAQAAIGVDTGLSHLAAALNIPTIAIYIDTNPALTGVVAGAQAQAINLGGIAQTPNVKQVLSALQQII